LKIAAFGVREVVLHVGDRRLDAVRQEVVLQARHAAQVADARRQALGPFAQEGERPGQVAEHVERLLPAGHVLAPAEGDKIDVAGGQTGMSQGGAQGAGRKGVAVLDPVVPLLFRREDERAVHDERDARVVAVGVEPQDHAVLGRFQSVELSSAGSPPENTRFRPRTSAIDFSTAFVSTPSSVAGWGSCGP